MGLLLPEGVNYYYYDLLSTIIIRESGQDVENINKGGGLEKILPVSQRKLSANQCWYRNEYKMGHIPM